MSTEIRYSCLKPEELEADLLTPNQLAEVLGFSSRQVSVWMQRKKIPYHKLGWHCVRIRLSEVLQRSLVPAETPFAPEPKKFSPKVNERRAEKKQLAALADEKKEAALPTQNATSAT